MRRRVIATIITVTLAAGWLAAACAPAAPALAPVLTETPVAPLPSTPPPQPTIPAIPAPTPSATPIAIDFFEPAGCKRPSDDYTPVKIGDDWRFNRRTVEMLQYAQELYGGELDLTGDAITQGSFSDNGPASFGTHLGGGAVDISVIRPGGFDVLYFDLNRLIAALRTAGFAAWVRDWDEVYPGSGIHIHAIAIGDKDLSPAAQAQLTGKFGYFRGYSGIPQEGDPVPDRHGGPLICAWMLEAGYSDLREADAPQVPQFAPRDWQERLRESSLTYLADSQEEARKVARRINWLERDTEEPANMCGPLAAALWRDAGLLPAGMGPANNLHNYWMANPRVENHPWAFFPPEDYELIHSDTRLWDYDFAANPLQPGDFVYAYAGADGYDHMFVVTEVDAQGRAYTVSNNLQDDGSFKIERLLLYDPTDRTAGVFHIDWCNRPKLGTTGRGGFDVLRPRGISQPPGTLYPYTVRVGDTASQIVARFNSTLQGIAAHNTGIDLAHLSLNAKIVVPVNIDIPAETP